MNRVLSAKFDHKLEVRYDLGATIARADSKSGKEGAVKLEFLKGDQHGTDSLFKHSLLVDTHRGLGKFSQHLPHLAQGEVLCLFFGVVVLVIEERH